MIIQLNFMMFLDLRVEGVGQFVKISLMMIRKMIIVRLNFLKNLKMRWRRKTIVIVSVMMRKKGKR